LVGINPHPVEASILSPFSPRKQRAGKPGDLMIEHAFTIAMLVAGIMLACTPDC